MPEGTALPTRHVALSDVRAAAARIAGTVLRTPLVEPHAVSRAAGGNVIEVSHQRLFAAPSVQTAELELMIEVRDANQGAAIVAALEAADYTVRVG